MRILRVLIAVLLAGSISWCATRAMHGNMSDVWGPFTPLTMPGVIVATPLAMFGLGNVHDPNLRVIDVVDFVFYSVLLYWLMERWRMLRAR